jgi:phosphoribosylformylglycinamidine cyclo-ligase
LWCIWFHLDIASFVVYHAVKRGYALLYREAGVDIDAAYEAKRRIGAMVGDAFGSRLPEGFGGFGSIYKPQLSPADDTYLVSSVDSVGTKVKVAIMADKHDTVGADIVNHCVNDILVCGAKPLFFMDYIATGRLNPDVIEELVSGLVWACKEADCPLIGGETAEMPGVYASGDYDLVGFIVGAVQQKDLLDGSAVEAGDVMIGLGSNGLHTNGYSLVRKIFFEKCGFSVNTRLSGLDSTLGEVLLAVHESYLEPVEEVRESYRVKALSHITGGGFFGNLPRVFPDSLDALVELGSWPVPSVFNIIQEKGPVPRDEMYRIFNMGIGMVMIVSRAESLGVLAKLESTGKKAWVIGRMVRGDGRVRLKEG